MSRLLIAIDTAWLDAYQPLFNDFKVICSNPTLTLSVHFQRSDFRLVDMPQVAKQDVTLAPFIT